MTEATAIYAKTARGAAEVAQRSAGLSLAARRVLIMVDGKRSAEDLTPFAPPGQFDELLQRLVQLNLVEQIGASPAAAATAPARPPSGEPRTLLTLDEAKRRAVRGLVERLGPEADGIASAIERCRSADELAERLRQAERLLAGMLGAEAAARYLQELRGRT
jgi:hypothetical protein